MNTAEYMNLVMREKGLKNDSEIAKALNWSRQKVSNYRHNKQAMDNEAARVFAEYMELPVIAVIADMEAQRQKDPSRKKAWRMLAKLSKQAGRATANTLFLLPFLAYGVSLCILCKIGHSRMIDNSDVSLHTLNF